MSQQKIPQNNNPITPSKLYYGWVIVIVSTLMMAVNYGLMYSYSVFFKPLAEHFDWDRATVSLVYSASLIIRGAFSIAVGWLADKYGAVKLMVFCGFMIGLGFILSGFVTSLWQFFLTYALVESLGMSGVFGIATATTSRWFINNRGLALGIVSAGVGIGTIFIVPGSERLINGLGWSSAFIICGTAAGIIMIISAFFLKPAPAAISPAPKKDAEDGKHAEQHTEFTVGRALRTPHMLLMFAAFASFFFGTQLIIVHLVNYFTDIGIDSLVAATFISIIGVVGIAGRLVAGAGSDRFGIFNTMIFTRVLLAASFLVLIISHDMWAFFLFAVVFGFTYGGEVPQIPMLVGKFSGTRTMATLIGLTLFLTNIGGAVGSWLAGRIFDLTSAYEWAFAAGMISAIISLVMALMLKRNRGK